MAKQALAVLESALRSRKLDRTLTSAHPPLDARADADPSATGIPSLDTCLQGGLPRGQLCEVAGPRSSGRTTVLLQLIAAATRRGELAALVDTCDRLDVVSADAAGIDLDRLLWVRGPAVHPGQGSATRAQFERAVDRALKALTLVLQAGGFGLVALDLADVPMAVLRRLPFTTWMRVQRMVEGRDTACVLIVSEPLARSAGGLTMSLGGRVVWSGDADRSRRLSHLDIEARVIAPRRRREGTAAVAANRTSDAHGVRAWEVRRGRLPPSPRLRWTGQPAQDSDVRRGRLPWPELGRRPWPEQSRRQPAQGAQGSAWSVACSR